MSSNEPPGPHPIDGLTIRPVGGLTIIPLARSAPLAEKEWRRCCLPQVQCSAVHIAI